MEFVPAGSEKAEEINRTYLREVDKPKFRPGMVVSLMNEEGFPNFGIQHHTVLWQTLDAKNPDKGYGVDTPSDGWRWFDRWVDAVRQHCEENREVYT